MTPRITVSVVVLVLCSQCYVLLNSCMHSVLCNLFWWQAFRMYHCIYYLHICVLSMHANILWFGHLFILQFYTALFVCTANRFSLCLHLVYTVWPLFSSFTLFSLGNHFLLPSTCTLLFGKKTQLFFSLWLTSSFIGYRWWEVFWSGELFQVMLWIREVNSCDYTPVIQERLQC